MNCSVRRLAIVTSRFPFASAEPYLRTELGELVKYFDRVAVVPVHRGRGKPQPLPAGVDVVNWPLYGSELMERAAHVALSKPAATFAAVGELLNSRDPGRLKNAAVMLKGIALADWLAEHHYDHVHAYWLSTPATVAYLASQIAGIGWSATAHRWDIYEQNAFDVKSRTAAFVRAISARGAADVWQRMPALQERVLHLRLGAAVPDAPAELRREGGPFRIICPAALVPVKGHADLLDAVAQLRTWGVAVQCTLAGNGYLRQALEHRAAALAISDCIDLPGFIPPEELHCRYRHGAYHAVVLASRANGVMEMEGVPSALIEAMAAGVPVVATDSGSITELLDGESGWIVPSSRPDALARALLEVYLNPGTARVRARRAFCVVSERHDVRTQMEAFAHVLSGERSLV